MPLYFAYGSNMDVTAMAARCPATDVVGQARLARHKLLINSDGYATVVRDPKGTVHGLLFDLALSDVAALDRYEGVSRGLYSKAIQPVLTAKGPKKALIYLARSSLPGVPLPGYLEGVIAAAQAAGLPPKYIGELALLGAPARARSGGGGR
jgi:gamma-glutamylcyclotransferase (GGCT)/AIG2-like uncharacterized protein YtfP